MWRGLFLTDDENIHGFRKERSSAPTYAIMRQQFNESSAIKISLEPNMGNRKNKRSASKTKLRIWAEFIPFLILCKVIRVIPLGVAYFISRQLFRGLYLIDCRHRVRTIEHLMHAGIAENRKQATALAKEAYLNFSMLLVEIFKMNQLIEIEKIAVKGSPAAIREACNTEGGNTNVIVITAHYGNWELAGSIWAEKFKIPMVSVMRPFANPLIGKNILGSRESDIHQSVPKEGGIRGLMRALKEGKTIAILADQHANRKEGVETVFFGQPCRTHSSPALLHLKTGVPIIPMLTRRVDRHLNFEFVIGDLIRYTPTGDKEKDVQAVTQMFTTALEKLIREKPMQWMWAHRRWLNLNRGAYNSD